MPRPATRHHRTISGDSFSTYLHELKTYALLTRDDEIELAKRIHQGDKDALDQLVCANLRFVVAVAKRYQRQGLPLADLVNEGNLGLIRAAEKFDETKGVRFISYAVWWVRQAMVQTLAEQGETIRIPVSRSRGSRDRTYVSLDAPVGDDGDVTLLDYFPDADSPPADKDTIEDDLVDRVGEALRQLKGREAEVVRLSFGLDQGEPMTLADIGEKLGVTRERVRQLKLRALSRLRRSSVAGGLASLHDR